MLNKVLLYCIVLYSIILSSVSLAVVGAICQRLFILSTPRYKLVYVPLFLSISIFQLSWFHLCGQIYVTRVFACMCAHVFVMTCVCVLQEIVVGSNMDKIYIVMDYVEHDLKSLMETMKVPFLIGQFEEIAMTLHI